MSAKLFVLLLVLLAALYFVGLGMTAFGGGKEDTSKQPESPFAEGLGTVLAPFRKPIAVGNVSLVTPDSSAGVTADKGRIRVPAGNDPRLVRLKISKDLRDSVDDVRSGELVWAPAAATETRPQVQSRYWDLEKKTPGLLPAGWERTAPKSFDPDQLKKSEGEDPFADAKPKEKDPLRLAVRHKGGVLDLRITSKTACTLELRK